MKDLNKVILIGRLGGDPVRRETKNGVAMTRFSLATSRKFKSGQDSTDPDGFAAGPGAAEGDEPSNRRLTEETIWHNVVAWGRQAEACGQYLSKGKAVFVEGMIRTHKYKDQEGFQRMAFEIHADNVGFLNGGMRRSGLPGTRVGNPAFQVGFGSEEALAEGSLSSDDRGLSD